ncbi:MAG: type II secretion system protein [Spongiibacteraceae bacterium]
MTVCIRKKQRGFTLIELVVVIVLLGITAVTFTVLITGSVRGYLDTANRQDSAAIARIALDRMARELREAVPQSIRISGSCLQYLPITASTVYTSLDANKTTVSVMDFAAPAGNGFSAVVYPISADELYNTASPTVALKPISNISGVDANGLRTITLASGFPAPRLSPGERLYVVSTPVSYCFSGTQLLRYTGPISATQPVPPSANLQNAALLVDKLTPNAGAFTYQAGNWQNNALVTIAFTIQQANNETLQFDHEVWLRNAQ